MLWTIGFGGEATFAHTRDALRRHDVACQEIDLDRLSTVGHSRVRLSNGHLYGKWDHFEWVLSPGDVVYQRVYYRALGPGKSAGLSAFLESFSAFCAQGGVVAVNPCGGGSDNGFKPLHLMRLAKVGFTTPRTLCSNDEHRVTSIVNPDGHWITKGCSGVRTRVERLGKEDFGRMASIEVLPVQIQERIPGDDVRVHCVGRAAVGVRITTDADDYRYASGSGRSVVTTEQEVPASILIRCQEHMHRVGLRFAGFDFRVDGESWTVLECNPMPGYDYYDRKVSGAISRLLCEELRSLSQPIVATGDGSLVVGDDDRPRLFLDGARRPKTQYS